MRSIGLFFLPFFLANLIYAQDAVLQANEEYKLIKVAETKRPALSFTFDFEGGFIFAQDLGGFYNVVKVKDLQEQALLERTSQPILNLGFAQGNVYVVTRGKINIISKGKLKELINGLPAYGDYGNGPVAFKNNEMYFSVGTATNSGVVGADNAWLASYPSFHDVSCADLELSSIQFETENFLTAKKKDTAATSAFSPFNTPNNGRADGSARCSGAIYKASLDGRALTVFAWGLHNPKSLSVDDSGHLFVLDGGMEDRGVRPVKNGRDSFYRVEEKWYGWPDYASGNPVEHAPLIQTALPPPPVPIAAYELNRLRSLLIAPKAFGLRAVGLDSNTVVAADGDFKLFEILRFADDKFQIKQVKFGPDGKLYVLASDDKTSSLYTIEPVNKPARFIAGASNKPASKNPWVMSTSLLMSGLAAVFAIKYRQRAV